MGAGIYNRRLAIDRKVEDQDSSGDPIATWPEIGEVWASIEPLSGRERDIDNDIRAEVDTRIRLRYSPTTRALTAINRGRYGDRVYNFVSVTDVGMRHTEMHILAKSGLNDG